MGRVYDSVEDGIGNSALSDEFMPSGYRMLTFGLSALEVKDETQAEAA